MNKILYLVSLLCFCGSPLYANPTKVTITGTNSCQVMNKFLGKDRVRLVPEKGNADIIIPDSLCEKWLILRTEEKMSRIYLLPGEHLCIDVIGGEWNFSGEGSETNKYLYDWYRAFYHDKPNVMLPYTEGTIFPGIQEPTVEELAKSEYLTWLSRFNEMAQKHLENCNLKDENFVKKQSEWIYCAWVETSVSTYLRLQEADIIPQSCLNFLRDAIFNRPLMMKYDGFISVMHAFFKLNEIVNGYSCSASDYLKERAKRIQLQELKEEYVLSELSLLVFKELTYQSDKIWEAVENVIVSQSGKLKYTNLKNKMAKLHSKDKSGTIIKPFAWENLDGSTIRSSKYAGKYLLIDAWTTHCGPCKNEMPFLRKLENYFKDAPICFLTLCLDPAKNKGTWKKISKELGIRSDCVIIAPDRTDNGSGWSEFYEIRTVPRYMLFDPDGKLVIYHGRRPSDPLLKKELQDILNYHK